MIVSNTTSVLNSFCELIGLHFVTWEQRTPTQYVSEERYEDPTLPTKIAAILNMALTIGATVKTVESSQGGTRVIIRQLDTTKIQSALEALQQTTPRNVQDAENMLNELCRFSWTGKNLAIGKALQEKLSFLEPSSMITIKSTMQKDTYYLFAESEYSDGNDKAPKTLLLKDSDIDFIIQAFKNNA